ncbi:MAG: antitoxin [Coriobacteriia bacterium]|nr:MAG: antitoxin [Coriobacteriia bacterium]
MEDADRRILQKIVSEIEYMEAILADMPREEFLRDETLERACAMTSINIGELAKHLSDSFNEEYSESELRFAARTRDVYAHGYFTLSFETVYKTATEDYPRVKGWVLNLLDA